MYTVKPPKYNADKPPHTRVCRTNQLVAARTLHCSCAVFVSGVWIMYILVQKGDERRRKKLNDPRKHRTPACESKIEDRDHFIVIYYEISILEYLAVRDTWTQMHSSAITGG